MDHRENEKKCAALCELSETDPTHFTGFGWFSLDFVIHNRPTFFNELIFTLASVDSRGLYT